jgi:hypothetical protein
MVKNLEALKTLWNMLTVLEPQKLHMSQEDNFFIFFLC